MFDLFNTSGFPARWHCGTWSQLLGWMHILSDIAIFGAYIALPVVLGYFARQRKDLPFPWIVWMFAAFILTCGTGHLVEAIIFYEPVYRFAGVWKVLTAVISWITVFGLIPLVPKLLTLRSPLELQAEVDRREAVEVDLLETNAQLEQFAYIASHDLKAPIRAIRMTAQFLREDIEDPEAVAAHLDALESRSSRMEGLVTGLLTMAEAGRSTGEVETVDPEDLIKSIATDLGDVRLDRISIESDVAPFATFRLGLEQVLSNLTVNALRHSETEYPKVLVRVYEDPAAPGFVHFSVEDNGPGIPEKYRERIFGLFQTLRSRDDSENTGIGLTIVTKVLQAVGGSIDVGDSHLGGAAFDVQWPKLKHPHDAATTALHPDAPEAPIPASPSEVTTP